MRVDCAGVKLCKASAWNAGCKRYEGMKRPTLWLVTTALAVGGALAGCTDLCEGVDHANVTYATKAQFADEMTACLQDASACLPLCADVFQVQGDVRECKILSVVYDDQSQHPASPALDMSA